MIRWQPTTMPRGRAALVGIFAAATALFWALPVLAQEFVKVDDSAREQLPATPFVAGAYGFIWVALLGYLLVVARGLGRVQTELEDLRRRLDRAGGELPPPR